MWRRRLGTLALTSFFFQFLLFRSAIRSARKFFQMWGPKICLNTFKSVSRTKYSTDNDQPDPMFNSKLTLMER